MWLKFIIDREVSEWNCFNRSFRPRCQQDLPLGCSWSSTSINHSFAGGDANSHQNDWDGKRKDTWVQSTRIMAAKWNNCFVMQLPNRNQCFGSKHLALSENRVPQNPMDYNSVPAYSTNVVGILTEPIGVWPILMLRSEIQPCNQKLRTHARLKRCWTDSNP